LTYEEGSRLCIKQYNTSNHIYSIKKEIVTLWVIRQANQLQWKIYPHLPLYNVRNSRQMPTQRSNAITQWCTTTPKLLPLIDNPLRLIRHIRRGADNLTIDAVNHRYLN